MPATAGTTVHSIAVIVRRTATLDYRSRPMNDVAEIRNHIEELVAEEHRLLSAHTGEGLSEDEHRRLLAITRELDETWDLLRRREAGQAGRLADADVPEPPNELDGPDPEPPHLEHGVHGEGSDPEPDINPNVP